ncbi:MAG TPA: hypothetical protein VGK02_09460 [Candidatus Aquicultor sp.]
MKKGLVVLMTTGLVLIAATTAYARTESNTVEPNPTRGNIVANSYEFGVNTLNKDWHYYEQSQTVGAITYDGYTYSTHPYGTWNSPYVAGIDGYNYNDAQDYVSSGEQVTDTAGNIYYAAGPHGGYLTSTHRCRECHAVHRAAGKFKLMRSDTRFEACDWCHGAGAGSGFNIQMDNDDAFTTEYNVGHTIGYGIDSGKWRAPDDTYPAYAPNYFLGGFSCFDCHTPHANPQRLFGFDNSGVAQGIDGGNVVVGGVNQLGKKFAIADPGHSILNGDGTAYRNIAEAKMEPIYLAGSWLLIKNPDKETATYTENSTETTGMTNAADIGSTHESTITITASQEIPDTVIQPLHQFDTDTPYPVNKVPTDWNRPIGSASSAVVGEENYGYNKTGIKRVWNIAEFCTDCHDGNAGLSSVEAPLFSEDRALRNNNAAAQSTDHWKGNYDMAYGHDSSPRHCERQMKFSPEDANNMGPLCRNCHRGSSACNACHNSGGISALTAAIDPGEWEENPTGGIPNNGQGAFTLIASIAANNLARNTVYGVALNNGGYAGASTYNPYSVSINYNQATSTDTTTNAGFLFKLGRTETWDANWRRSPIAVTPGQTLSGGVSQPCSDNGFSWPHRTLGWKMLKDDLFGLDFDGTTVMAGQVRDAALSASETTATAGSASNIAGAALAGAVTHDIDSVCLDCHNPTVWNANGTTHTDTGGNTIYNDELLLRGLP